MGIHRRYSAPLLAFLLSGTALATERVAVDPYIKAGPGYSAANGSLTGYVPTKPNADLLLEAERKGWLGSGSAKTPVTVKPKVTIPVGGLASKLKSGLKTNVGQLVLGAAVSGAVAGVGWVMSDDNTKIQKKKNSSPADMTGNYNWVFRSSGGYPYYNQVFKGASPGGLCAEGTKYWIDYNKGTPATILSVDKISDTSYACKVSFTSGGLVYKPTWVMTRQGTGCTAPAVYDSATSSCVITSLVPISDADYDLLDPWVAQQSAAWLKGLLSEVCGGTYGGVNPQACYDGLQKQSAAIISGPTSVQGPQTTSTGTYTRADGTTGTTSSTTNTTYNITYGDRFYDYTTVTTTTNMKDGQITDSNTTTDTGTPQETPPEDKPEEEEQDYVVTDSELPKVDPFYEQQYPDGLQGVWDGKQAEFQDSAFVSFLHSFVPSFSGSCPAFSLSFAIAAWANYGTIQFSSICYALDLVKVVILVSALFLCRALIFGG
ncbi:hypothetical protein P3W53_12905 [Pseudomonas denitrificans (nom. rej.)]|nr:hypothetical protein [Pseudomonas denitrificans (nom. rej.)]